MLYIIKQSFSEIIFQMQRPPSPPEGDCRPRSEAGGGTVSTGREGGTRRARGREGGRWGGKS